LNQTVQLLKS